MQDYYLKFADEASANSILYTIEPAQIGTDGEEISPAITKAKYANIDVIGVIYEQQNETFVALPGWHVNVRVVGDEDGSRLEPFAVQPTSPRRVWA